MPDRLEIQGSESGALKRPLRCRLGWHKKRLRQGPWAERTFLLIGVNLYECELCDWYVRGLGEPDGSSAGGS